MLDGMLKFIGFNFLLGAHVWVGKPARRIHFCTIICIRFEWCGGTSLLASEFVIAGIGDGTHQPSFEGATTKRINTAKGRDEGFLRGISGKLVIANDAQRDVEDHVLIMKNKCVECVEVAVLSVLNKGRFVHRVYLTTNVQTSEAFGLNATFTFSWPR